MEHVVSKVRKVRLVHEVRVVWVVCEVRVVRDVRNYGMHRYAFGTQESVPKSKTLLFLFETDHRQ